MYVYDAELWCDSCGERIAAEIDASGVIAAQHERAAILGDSDHYPQQVPDDGESDSPNHCAAGSECLEAVDLGEYGLAADAELFGAESRRIGALLPESLTPEGVGYLCEMLDEDDPTPYQTALHRFWLEVFGDEVYSAAIAAAEADGRAHGLAAGSWATDGNTPADSARNLARGIAEGDFSVVDSFPSSPLAGQWADDPSPREVLDGFGFGFIADHWTEASDEVLTAWSDAWQTGYSDQAERDSIRAGYLRSVTRDGWRLRTYYAGFDSFSGKTRLGYEFGRAYDTPLFAGEDFYCSPLHADDSDESVRSLLGFLTLKSGDTDSEYFETYTADQVRFSEEHAETVAMAFGLWDEDEAEPLGNDWDTWEDR